MDRVLLFVVGVAAAVTVTARSHRSPSKTWWVEPVANGSPLRRTDMPVVGSGLLLVAGGLHLVGRRRAAARVAAVGAGAALGPLATGLADPLS
ncbi:MAG: hypothetical protein ACRYF3_03040 [Janthinobacterium lividum]